MDDERLIPAQGIAMSERMSDIPAEAVAEDPVAEDDAPIVSVVAPLGNLGAVIVKRPNGDGLCAQAPCPRAMPSRCLLIC